MISFFCIRGYCTLVINIQIEYWRHCDWLNESLLENKQETLSLFTEVADFIFLKLWYKETKFIYSGARKLPDSVLGYYNWK